MPKRRRLTKEKDLGGLYFATPRTQSLFASGCTVLDCVLGGGYCEGRIVNIVGDKSTGKTLLAIEACANFHKKYPDGEIYYNEVEAAFDVGYAEGLGLPREAVSFVEGCFAVEDVFENLQKVVLRLDDNSPALYIIDSLDALSDRGELARKIDEGTYGAEKAKKMSQLFRRLVQSIETKKLTLMIISQVRDNIGVTFGKKVTRSGGRALDFYASQVVFLSQIKRLTKIRRGITRVVGVHIKAKCEKNKVGAPFRECEFPVVFRYGIDNLKANLQFFKDVKYEDEVRGLMASFGYTSLDKASSVVDKMTDKDYRRFDRKTSKKVKRVWAEIESRFIPTRRKYGG